MHGYINGYVIYLMHKALDERVTKYAATREVLEDFTFRRLWHQLVSSTIPRLAESNFASVVLCFTCGYKTDYE
jgi:hypothetical protein